MLAGREVMKLQNMEYKKSMIGIRNLGSFVVYEGGIAFHKAKGALAAGIGFGLVGQFFSRNNEKSEAEIEVPFSQIRSVRLCSVMMYPAIEITLRDGSTVSFYTQSRIFNGKSDLERVANYISSQIR